MAGKLEIPDIRNEPVVALHYEGGYGEGVILQVPRGDGSSTFRLKLKEPEHFQFLSSLPNGRRIIDVLRTEGHLAVRPGTGEYAVLEDEKNAPSGFYAALVSTGREGGGSSGRESPYP